MRTGRLGISKRCFTIPVGTVSVLWMIVCQFSWKWRILLQRMSFDSQWKCGWTRSPPLKSPAFGRIFHRSHVSSTMNFLGIIPGWISVMLYQVVLVTSPESSNDNDFSVSILLEGEKGDTGKRILGNAVGTQPGSCFKPGNVSPFPIQLLSIMYVCK